MFEEERYADYTTLAMKLLDSETLPLQEKLVVFERLSEIYTGKNESLLKASQLIYDKHSKDFEVAKNHVLILIENQQTKKALEIARKAANANKENYHAWRLALNIASTYWDYAVLFEDAKKALEFFPTMPRLYFDAAKGAIYAKKLNEAIELLAAGELYILDDRQAGALYDMRKGEIYFAKKEYKKGIIAFESALNKAKNKSAVYSTYALELSKANIATEVAENLLSELKNPDQDRNYFLAHGYLSLHSKNYDFGISLLNEGVKATFNNAEIFDLLGDLYFRKGAIDKAIEAWEEAMVLESRNKNLSQKIKEKNIMLQSTIKSILIFIAIVTLASCGRSKDLHEENAIKLPKVKEELLISRLDSLSENRPDHFYTKLSSKYSDSKYNVSFKTSIRMRSDSALHALITFARIPIYNTMVTPDTLTMVDKRNNCYMKEGMEYLKTTFGVDFKHENIEELILGMPIAWDDEIAYNQVKDPYNYVISSTSKRRIRRQDSEDFIIRYFLSNDTRTLRKTIIDSPKDTTSITINYYGRELVNGFNIPTEGDIKVDTPNDELFIDFKYNKTSVNDPRVLYLAIPKRYDRCE
ncbi:hypothetical protein CW751_02345 [Brumimicrobium salinarum]|uniref:Uncharacterized protein n=2 Tax=Brumimicrobium salinarum TaxID=2058658 RepID=A0A2I0R6I3_9FLAO|nr:hypothetical protein CW751_02345 [Brumimicrobium salinarum]